MNNNENCCIARILKVIEILQKNACCSDFCTEGCDRPILGPNVNSLCYNTRPFNLYNKNGELFTVTYTSNGTTLESSTFRVEKVKNCCAKLRILNNENNTITSTNNFITVNLKCMCCISCLNDLALENVC